MSLDQTRSVSVDLADDSDPVSEHGPLARSLQGQKSKERVTLHLDVDVVSMFRATGRGWQNRMNAALREWLGPPWSA